MPLVWIKKGNDAARRTIYRDGLCCLRRLELETFSIELDGIAGFVPPYGSYCDFPIQEGCKGIIDFYSSPGASERVVKRPGTHYVFISDDRSTAQYFRPATTSCEIITFKVEAQTRLPLDVFQQGVERMDADPDE